MQGRGRFENRVTELASISRGLKGLAKELNVPVVVLSQLSRAPEQRPSKRPQLSDLRESGALEQDADVVIMIYREDMYEATEENQGIAELIVAKQRNGPTGSVQLAFIREFTRFENLEASRRCVIRSTLAARRPRRARRQLPQHPAFVAAAARARPMARPGPPWATLAPGVIGVVKANAYGHGAAGGGPRARGARAPRCSRAPTSRRPSRCARPASAAASSSSAPSA